MSAFILINACAGRPVVKPIWLLPEECEILPRPERLADTVTVVVGGEIEPEFAPWPRHKGERIIFRHLYETLVSVDCSGGIHPCLARSWRRERGGRRWVFEMVRGLKFWDGSSLKAQDVVASWQDAVAISSVIDSVRAESGHSLHVFFRMARREFPRELSSFLYAVTKSFEDSEWPIGTGPYEIATEKQGSGDVSKNVHIARPASRGRKPVIKFLGNVHGDARDLLERGIDVIVTEDPSVIAYAAERDELEVRALPWDRTYVVVSPFYAEEAYDGRSKSELPREFLARLARDAVRSDARTYEKLPWWNEAKKCLGLSFASKHAFSSKVGDEILKRGTLRILYEANDRVAKDLSERIVALLASDTQAYPERAYLASMLQVPAAGTYQIIARGVAAGEFDASLKRADDFAYVCSIPRMPPDPCLEANEQMSRIPWLAALGGDFFNAVIPLVDARMHVIARRGRFGMIVDGWGDILITNGKREMR